MCDLSVQNRLKAHAQLPALPHLIVMLQSEHSEERERFMDLLSSHLLLSCRLQLSTASSGLKHYRNTTVSVKHV